MRNVVVLGSGNVATHLAQAFFNVGYVIKQIYSVTHANATNLAQKVKAIPISEIRQLDDSADLYLVCVTDSAIHKIVDEISFDPSLIAHSAGSIPMSVLSRFKNHGVFYPLQTFSKNQSLNISTVPFCIEASNEKSKNELMLFAHSLSDNVQELSTEQRKQCHLAAVFANNFVNHFYTISQKLLAEKNISFDILKPLIFETARKVQTLNPKDAQTGPAVRNNTAVINKHLTLLASSDLEKMYSFVTQSILSMHGLSSKE